MLRLKNSVSLEGRWSRATDVVFVPPPAPSASNGLSDADLLVGIAMTAIDVSTDFTGNGVSYSLAPSSAALPNGLSLSSTGIISGTPTDLTSARSIVVRGTNASGFADSAFSLAVVDGIVLNSVDFVPGNPPVLELEIDTTISHTNLLVVGVTANSATPPPVLEEGQSGVLEAFSFTPPNNDQVTTEITGLTATSNDATHVHVEVREVGGGNSRSMVLTEAVSGLSFGSWSITDNGDGTITISSTPPIPASLVLTDNGDGTIDIEEA